MGNQASNQVAGALRTPTKSVTQIQVVNVASFQCAKYVKETEESHEG